MDHKGYYFFLIVGDCCPLGFWGFHRCCWPILGGGPIPKFQKPLGIITPCEGVPPPKGVLELFPSFLLRIF